MKHRPPSHSSDLEQSIEKNFNTAPQKYDFDLVSTPPADNDDWLMTYTDLVTLLITLFIVMVAHASFDKNNGDAGLLPLSTSIPRIFHGEPTGILETGKVFDPASVEANGVKTSDLSGGAEDGDSLDKVAEPDPEKVKRAAELQSAVNKAGLQDSVEIEVISNEIAMRINEKVLFPSGQADLSGQGQKLLEQIIPTMHEGHYQIVVEGHTDNIPISTDRYPSNWELSAARAISVIHFFENQKISKDRMSAVAFGDAHPIESNDSEEGRQRNRRVQIVLR